MKVHLTSSEPVYKNWGAVMGSTQPQRRAISIAGIAIQVFLSIEHGKKLLTVRRWSRLWEAYAAMSSCVSRSFDFCAMTSRYLLRDRTPFTVTTIAMARGGLSCELNGVLSP